MRTDRAHGCGRRLPIVLGLLLAGTPLPGHATQLDFLQVGDPLEAELRTLDVLGEQFRLPHLGTGPIQLIELQGLATSGTRGAAQDISLIRLSRALAREGLSDLAPGAAPRTTPRILQLTYPDDQRLDLSVGLEGRVDWSRGDTRIESGSGLHFRTAAGFRGLLAYSHLTAAHVEGSHAFAEPLFPANQEFIIRAEESYFAYRGSSGPWGVQFGRSRWRIGPGVQGSLLLSQTAVPLTGLALRGHFEPLRADGFALSATLDAAAGEQLAVHRLEWQPLDGLRIGAGEAARYKADAWKPLYLVGLIPYTLVERLEIEDRPESVRVLRNNVLVAFDVAWRMVPGIRVYGEGLIDDIPDGSGGTTRKYGYQLGWEGVRPIDGGRVVWGAEYTRLTRYVYTSFFGRRFTAQDLPLGFPTGPDARRIQLHVAWDPSYAWQLTAAATRTDKGENGLDEPFVRRVSPTNSESFEGIVERRHELEVGLRFWPESGVDLSLRAGYRWIENLDHARGIDERTPTGALVVRLDR
jgi:hypothetical protein